MPDDDQQHQQAAEILEALLERDPSNTENWYRYAMILYSLHRPHVAREAMRKAVHLDPNHKSARRFLGLFSAKCNDPEDAINSWKRAIELDPSNKETYGDL